MSEYKRHISNLTQHLATEEQIADGVFNLSPEKRATLQGLLTFEEPPFLFEVLDRAQAIADLCESRTAMIGGAPFLMSALENALKGKGVEVLYSFSKREVVEVVEKDGSTKKVSVFRHTGFVNG